MMQVGQNGIQVKPCTKAGPLVLIKLCQALSGTEHDIVLTFNASNTVRLVRKLARKSSEILGLRRRFHWLRESALYCCV